MINITGLNTFLNDKHILKDIKLSIPSNKLTVILGPNGSGKTTLLKTILGLIKKDSGNILIDNKNMETMNYKEIAQNISYLSQSRNIPCIMAEKMVLHGRFPHMSWPRRYSEKDYELVYEAMKKTDSFYLRKRMMNELSGGERQKVFLAMSLAQDTNIIFMDEPTTYLDPENQLSIMKIANELCENENKSIVMVLHDLSLALRNADNIVVMKNGNILKSGDKEYIFNSKIIDTVFNVSLKRTLTDKGYQYWANEREE